MLAISFTASDVIALGALGVAALTIGVNYVMQVRRLQHEREQASKGVAADTFADASVFGQRFLTKEAIDAVIAQRDGDTDELQLWYQETVVPERDAVNRKVAVLIAIGWSDHLQVAAAALNNAIIVSNRAIFMMVMCDDTTSREKAVEGIVKASTEYLACVSEVRVAIAKTRRYPSMSGRIADSKAAAEIAE